MSSELWLRMHNLERCAALNPLINQRSQRRSSSSVHSPLEKSKIVEKLSHSTAKRVLPQNSLDMFQKRLPTRAIGLVTQQPSRFHAFAEVLRIYELASVTRLALVTSSELFTNDSHGFYICS